MLFNVNNTKIKPAKVKTFLVNGEENQMKRFKKRKDIEVIDIYFTEELDFFMYYNVVYKEVSSWNMK